jgi:hypothetical protein
MPYDKFLCPVWYDFSIKADEFYPFCKKMFNSAGIFLKNARPDAAA